MTTRRLAHIYAARIAFAATAAAAGNRFARFDGKGGGVRVANEDMALPDGPFTLEAMVRADDQMRRRFVAAKGAMRWTGERGEYHLILDRGRPQFMVRLDERFHLIRARRPLSPGMWHHIAGVYDGEEIRLYVSGRLAGSHPARGTRDRNTMPFIVGAGPHLNVSRNNAFLGAVDEVRLSRTARYHGPEISVEKRHPPDADTFVLFNFDRGPAPVALESSGNQRHGILAGATMFGRD